MNSGGEDNCVVVEIAPIFYSSVGRDGGDIRVVSWVVRSEGRILNRLSLC